MQVDGGHVEGYLELVHEPSKVLSYQLLGFAQENDAYFSASKHRKAPTHSLFNICQGHGEWLQEYKSHFNKETIKVVHLCQDIFVGAFLNSLKAKNFNRSLAQKSTSTMEEIMAPLKYHIYYNYYLLK